jgi:DNA-directed RNA polymerase specialized sigma24 family protein
VLERVPPAARLAWVLRFQEGEPLEVVAQLCACSLATAKRRIKTAQDRIREAFGEA